MLGSLDLVEDGLMLRVIVAVRVTVFCRVSEKVADCSFVGEAVTDAVCVVVIDIVTERDCDRGAEYDRDDVGDDDTVAESSRVQLCESEWDSDGERLPVGESDRDVVVVEVRERGCDAEGVP